MAPAHEYFKLAKSAMRLQIAHVVPPLGKQVAHLLDQIAIVRGDMALEFLARLHHDFRRGGRSRRAQVGHKIRDREIGFVPDAR